MSAVRWVTITAEEVPDGEAWLGPRERRLLASLDGERRRADWRLGRWAGKLVAGADVEILPAADGAPEGWRGEERVPLSLSISHRRGRAMAATDERPVGCDLEPLREDRDVVAFVAREAAVKALRRGLLDAGRPRLDVRDGAFAARWPDGAGARGTCWLDAGWAFAVAVAVASPGDRGVET